MGYIIFRSWLSSSSSLLRKAPNSSCRLISIPVWSEYYVPFTCPKFARNLLLNPGVQIPSYVALESMKIGWYEKGRQCTHQLLAFEPGSRSVEPTVRLGIELNGVRMMAVLTQRSRGINPARNCEVGNMSFLMVTYHLSLAHTSSLLQCLPEQFLAYVQGVSYMIAKPWQSASLPGRPQAAHLRRDRHQVGGTLRSIWHSRVSVSISQ